MSRHTIEAEITIIVEIEYEYEPGYLATGPSYASGGEPGAAAEVSFVGAKITGGDALTLTWRVE